MKCHDVRGQGAEISHVHHLTNLKVLATALI